MFLTASIGGGWEHMKNITNTTGGAGFSCGRWEQYLFLYLFPSPLAVLVEKINPTNESRDSFNSDIIRAFRIFYVFIAICENHHKVTLVIVSGLWYSLAISLLVSLFFYKKIFVQLFNISQYSP